jgi:hypothetical protein
MGERPKIGEILVSAGIIDEMQLASALGEQARWGKRLGVTLIKMGMVEEDQLIRGLAVQLDLPVASLAGKRIAPDVLALVPARVATEHGVVPLFTRGQGRQAQLFLGMEDPSNFEVVQDLTFRTGLEIRPVMVGPTEISEAINRFYHRRQAIDPTETAAAAGDPLSLSSLRALTDEDPEAGETLDPPAEDGVLDSAAEVGSARVANTLDPVWDLPGGWSPESEEDESGSSVSATREPDTTPSAVEADSASDASAAPESVAEVSLGADQPCESADEDEPLEFNDEALRSDSESEPEVAPATEVAADDRVEFGQSGEPSKLVLLEQGIQRLEAEVERLKAESARAAAESEKTRAVAKALTQLLVAEGHLSLEAIQNRAMQLKAS